MEAANTKFDKPAPAGRTTMLRTESTTAFRRLGKQLFGAPAEDQPPNKKGPAKPASRQPKMLLRLKLERARPRIMLLIACTAYLVSALVALNIGLLNILDYVKPKFERAQLAYQAQSSTLRKEQIIYGRLDGLLSSQLNRSFMETHEDCLVRGLKKADYELLGYGLQYVDIRAQIMDWTMENCGRLQYTPQVVQEEPSPRHVVMTYWANVSYRSRQMAEGALGFVKQIWGRIFSRSHPKNTSVDTTPAPAGNETAKVFRDQRLRTKVPFGFILHCLPSKPCRLFYPYASTRQADKLGLSPESIARFEREARDLHKFSTQLANLRWAINLAMHRVLFCIQCFLTLALCVATAFIPVAQSSPQQKRSPISISTFRAKFTKEDKYVMVSLFIEGIGMKAFAMLQKGLGASWPEEVTVFHGLGMLLLGLTMLLSFFFPNKKLEDIFRVCELVKEIYLIARGHTLPGEKKEVASPSTVDAEPKKTANEPTHAVNNSTEKGKATEPKSDQQSLQDKHVERTVNATSTVSQPPKPQHRIFDPTTTVHEDLEVERKNLRKELKRAAVDTGESEFDSDTDTDTDFKHESSFVDLASGVTPDVTEAESGWSLVD